MSWQSTLTRLFGLLVFAVLLAPTFPVQAQNLESALMPGSVIQGHATVESSCNKCHVRFERNAQPALCLDCHKAVAADVRGRTGYHGRFKGQARECRTCHTEHKGRRAKVILLDEAKFDHNLTDYPLHGKHQGKACAACHRTKAKHRSAPSDCNSCHHKEDMSKGHKGGLGVKCENCHDETGWKGARFDHGKTHFPLLHSHAEVKCADCHIDNKYAKTPSGCASCHRTDDEKNGHKGRFGQRCETCHNETKWKSTTFRHERDTRYTLLDRHRSVKCESCHRAPLYREKTPTRCVACHRADDPHKGTLGEKCESCHAEKGWKSSSFDHGRDTHFALRDKHRVAKCSACHKDSAFRDKLPSACVKCHDKDDHEKGHKGRFGELCESCHNEKSFKSAIFDHDFDTLFMLSGRHARLKCDSCHREPLYRARLDIRCLACHKSDDVHFGSFGSRCEDCHAAAGWRNLIKRKPFAQFSPGAAKPPGREP